MSEENHECQCCGDKATRKEQWGAVDPPFWVCEQCAVPGVGEPIKTTSLGEMLYNAYRADRQIQTWEWVPDKYHWEIAAAAIAQRSRATAEIPRKRMAGDSLFIGGSHDGEWIAVPRDQHQITLASKICIPGKTMEVEVYFKQPLATGTREHLFVFIHQSLPTHELVPRLVAHYRA